MGISVFENEFKKIFRRQIFSSTRYVVVFAMILAIVGCSSPSVGVKKSQSADSSSSAITPSKGEMLVAKTSIQLRPNPITYLEIDGSLDVDSPQLSSSADFVCSILRHDSVSVNIKGPFGIQVGKMFSSPEHFVFFNTLENVVYEGAPTSSAFSASFQSPLNYNELTSFMRYELPFPSEEFSFSKALPTGQNLFSRKLNDSLLDFAVFESGDSTLATYQRKRKDGAIVFNAVFEKPTTIAGTQMSKKMTFAFPDQKTSVGFNFKNVRTEKEQLKQFSFTPPSNTPRRKF